MYQRGVLNAITRYLVNTYQVRVCTSTDSINLESPSLPPPAQYDQELGEAIELEYLRFMPFMNKALARLVQEEHPQYANDADDQVS